MDNFQFLRQPINISSENRNLSKTFRKEQWLIISMLANKLQMKIRISSV